MKEMGGQNGRMKGCPLCTIEVLSARQDIETLFSNSGRHSNIRCFDEGSNALRRREESGGRGVCVLSLDMAVVV